MKSPAATHPEFQTLHRVTVAGLLFLLSSCAAPSTPASRWWGHIQHLAADSLQGRNTGSQGYLEAARYVADQFRLAGAEPAGSDGFFQPVAFVAHQIREGESSLTLVRGGDRVPLRLGEDATLSIGFAHPRTIEAPMVFVGYGLSVPERGWNDLEGLDLHGKIAVFVRGGPASVPDPLRSHMMSTAERWRALHAAGAIGMVSIANPKFMDIPWERATLARLRPSMFIADSTLDDVPGLELSVRINPAHAEELFAGSGHHYADLLALTDAEKPLPRFPLPGTLRATVSYDESALESPNVVGIVRGSDPRLRDEFVVLSAHLDHLGIGGAVKGDSIYNGAMDNASGVATLLEIAREARESKLQLKRSLVLLAVTGEEKGLEGSRYFTASPTVPAGGIVADLNMDMFLPIVPFRSLIVYGLDESDLGDQARQIAAHYGVSVMRDPEPQRNLFIRSDQYNFILHGVPSLSFKFGYEPGSPEDETFKAWTRDRYHAPSDDLEQPVNKEGAVRFNRLLLALAAEVANQPERPRWKDTSFFKRFVARAGA